MNVLVIGGCHVGNYGIQAHEGFVQQWANQLELQSREPVEVTVLSMVKLTHISALLEQYRWEFNEADLIILQLGHYELSWRKPFAQFFKTASQIQLANDCTKPVYYPKTPKSAGEVSPISQHEQLKNTLKAGFLTLYSHTFGQIPYLKDFSNQLANTFTQLRSYQEKIIVMTPFPTLHEVDQWLRRESYLVITQTAVQAGFMVVDTFSAIPRYPSYFLADGIHLNQTGHLKVALRLHELPLRANYMNQQFADW